MATKKARRFARKKTVRRRRTATAGKIMPPLDVRSNKHLEDFKKRITKGPLTIVLVYADWCGHCHTMMPHFDAAAKSPTRSVQAVKVNEQMLPAVNQLVNKTINKSAKPLNVEGYPSIIMVNTKGEKVTDIEPVRNTKTMTEVMNKTGNLAVEAKLNTITKPNNKAENIVENAINNITNVSKNVGASSMPNIKNKANTELANLGMEETGLAQPASGLASGTPLNSDVGEEELKGSIISLNTPKKNIALKSIKATNLGNAGKNSDSPKDNLKNAVAPSPLNTFSEPKKPSVTSPNITAPAKNVKAEAEAITSLASPVQPPNISDDLTQSISNNLTPAQKISGGGRRGGSLMEAMASTTYTLATPAALLATAALVLRNGKKTRKQSKRQRQTKSKRRQRR